MMEGSKYLLGTTYQPGGAILGMNTALGFKYELRFLPANILIAYNGIIASAWRQLVRDAGIRH